MGRVCEEDRGIIWDPDSENKLPNEHMSEFWVLMSYHCEILGNEFE